MNIYRVYDRKIDDEVIDIINKLFTKFIKYFLYIRKKVALPHFFSR